MYEREHVVHEYTQTLAVSSAGQHLLCWACCVLSVLSTQPSAHPDHQTAEREIGGWPILFGIRRILLLFFFRSSVRHLPYVATPPFLLASCLPCFVATKRTCRRHGQSSCWPRMLDQSKYNEKRTQHVSSWPNLRVSRRVPGFIRSKSDEARNPIHIIKKRQQAVYC